MAFRRDDDGGFGSGFGGSFGTSGGYDPHRGWDGPLVTRGVNREGSRVHREHEDEHPYGGRGYQSYGPAPQGFREHGGFSNYAGGGTRDRPSGQHLSEVEARRGPPGGPSYPQEQHGYGQSQFPYNAEPDRGPHYGKGPKGYKRSDERIHEEVCELMSRQGHIDASDVEVTVEAGVVRLVGTVASRPDKRGLEQIADRVHGVEEVRNELRLRRDNATATPPLSTRGTLPQNGQLSQNVKPAQS